MRVGPHPHALPLGRSKTRSSRRPQALFNARGAPPPRAAARSLEDSLLAAAAGALQCAWGPTPTRCRSVARRLAPRGGRRRSSIPVGPHPHAVPLGRSKTRSSRRPQALLSLSHLALRTSHCALRTPHLALTTTSSHTPPR